MRPGRLLHIVTIAFIERLRGLDVGVDLKRVTSYGTHLSDGALARFAAGDRVSSFYDQSSCRMHGLA
jgi:hypothetical protein